MSRRALGEMVAEVGMGLLPALANAAGLSVRRIAVDLPVEIDVRGRGRDAQLLGDMPRLVTRTVFDITPSRMVVVWEAEP